MRDEISKLVLGIGGAMKDFAGGKLSLADAESACARFTEEYDRMEAELRNEDAPGLLEGVLYHHGIRNFSSHSGLYLGRKDSVIPLARCGDEGLATRIAGVLRARSADLASGDVRRFEPESVEVLPQSLHAVRAASAGPEPVFFAALSSSPYFSEEAFAYTAAILGLMIEGHADVNQQYSYYTAIQREADEFIRANMDQSHDIMTNIFIFRNIEKIFNHMGFHTLIEVSDQIRQTLVENFPAGSLCVASSLRMYLVFTRHLRKRGAELKGNRVDFIYRGITLPFHRLNITLDVSSHRDSFWYDIHQFEDYVLTGDYY